MSLRPPLAFFATLLLLWAVLAEVNHGLSTRHISVFADALYFTFPALLLSWRSAFASALLAGFIVDANAPVAFGTHAFLFALAAAVLFRFRDRLPHEETVGRVAIALLVNFLLYFAVAFIALRGVHPAPWTRLAFDLIASQIFLALVAPWFFALQDRAIMVKWERRS